MRTIGGFVNSSYTQVVFRNDLVEVDHDVKTDQYSVRAIEDLKAGTLVLLEHVVAGSMLQVVSAVSVCPTLRSMLYPRKASRHASSQERQQEAEEAVAMNAFDFDGVSVIGAAFSMFNHSCKPNCHMDLADKIGTKLTSKDTADVRIYGMWTHRAITAGDELTIDYVNGGGEGSPKDVREVHAAHMAHYGFRCDCDEATLSLAPKRAQVHKNLGGAFRTRDEAWIRRLTDAHLEGSSALEVMKRHVLAQNGFFPAVEGGGPLVVTVQMEDPMGELKKIQTRLGKLDRMGRRR